VLKTGNIYFILTTNNTSRVLSVTFVQCEFAAVKIELWIKSTIHGWSKLSWAFDRWRTATVHSSCRLRSSCRRLN